MAWATGYWGRNLWEMGIEIMQNVKQYNRVEPSNYKFQGMQQEYRGRKKVDLEQYSIEELLLLAFSYGLVSDGWFLGGSLHLTLGRYNLALRESNEGRAFLEKLIWGHELATTLAHLQHAST